MTHESSRAFRQSHHSLHNDLGLTLGALSFLLAAAGLVATGCGKDKGMTDESGMKLEEAAKPYVGVYQITALTHNEGGCGVEGPSALREDSDKFLVMSMGKNIMGKVLQLSSCKDIGKCKAYAKEPGAADFIHSFGDMKGKALTGVEFFTGFSKEKTCEKGSSGELRLEKDGDGIKIEKRAILVSYPADDRGFCSTKEVKKHAKDKPCGQLTVIRAKRVADL